MAATVTATTAITIGINSIATVPVAKSATAAAMPNTATAPLAKRPFLIADM